MQAVEILVAIGSAIVAGQVIARRLHVAPPIVLVALGLLLNVVPGLRTELPAEAVLVLFLPALLFWESLTISARDTRRFMRGILLSGTLLVVVTAGVTAVIVHAFGASWGTAWVVGAAIAPTDATAVAALRGALPRRTMTILRAESLINDGTALVVYALALEIATGPDTVTVPHVLALFGLSFVGGVGAGLLVGAALFEIRRRLRDPMLNAIVLLLAPFAAYFAAESIKGSGVLAVVTCGLLWARKSPGVISAASRQQSAPFWTLTTFVLNGGLFVLIGLEIPVAIGGLSPAWVGAGLLIAVAAYLGMIATRLLFLVISAYLIRWLDRRPAQRELRTTNRARLVSTVAGFRGAVSLAVALSVPAVIGGLDRDMVIFVTAVLVIASLVVQGLALPRVVGWARLPHDRSEHDELELATTRARHDALAALPRTAKRLGIDQVVVQELEQEYADSLAEVAGDVADDPKAAIHRAQARQLRLALISVKRHSVIRLRNEGTIDDIVLRQIQARLDIEEVRLSGPHGPG